MFASGETQPRLAETNTSWPATSMPENGQTGNHHGACPQNLQASRADIVKPKE